VSKDELKQLSKNDLVRLVLCLHGENVSLKTRLASRIPLPRARVVHSIYRAAAKA
jgi:hypothetical protein